MLALQISSMKLFMNQLLATDAFDLFLLQEAVITTANTYTIDGRMNRDFFSKEELENGSCPYEFQPWSEIRGLCFHLIKGKHTPLFFKFILQLNPQKAAALLKDHADADFSAIKSLVLSIRYDGSKAILTTATAQHTFVLSREADLIWDTALCAYLAYREIPFEIL